MSNELEVIDPKEFGLEEKQANDLTKGLTTILSEREVLIENYKEVMLLEITEENLERFKALRLLIRDNRTKGIEKWHKVNKAFFWTGGKFVDATRNKEIIVNEGMEEKLMKAEKTFETLEKERIAKIQAERVVLVSEYVDNAAEMDLSSMADDVFDAFLSTKKQNHLDKVAEELRIEKERQAKIKAEKAEQDRIKKENARLKKEAEEREAKAEKEISERKTRAVKFLKSNGFVDDESDVYMNQEYNSEVYYEDISDFKSDNELELFKTSCLNHIKECDQMAKDRLERESRLKKEAAVREKQEAKLKAEQAETARLKKIVDDKEASELKTKQDEEKRVQAELKKGDTAKVKDLISDLEAIKGKYQFKSKANQKKASEVDQLIDKVINHINK